MMPRTEPKMAASALAGHASTTANVPMRSEPINFLQLQDKWSAPMRGTRQAWVTTRYAAGNGSGDGELRRSAARIRRAGATGTKKRFTRTGQVRRSRSDRVDAQRPQLR